MSAVVDGLREQSIQPPDESESFYIYNQNTNRELWGSLVRYEHDTYREYELDIQHEAPIGQILTDIISLDVQETMNLSEVEAAIAPHIFSINEEIAQDNILFWIEKINSIRNYIDICNKNEAFFEKRCFNVFRDMGSFKRGQIYTEFECLVEEEKIQKSVKFHTVATSKMFEISLSKDPLSKIADSVNLSPEQEKLSPKTIAIETYEHPMAYFYRSLEVLVENKLLPKRCKNCGKFFVPEKRSDTLYCNRIAPESDSQTCKVYGTDQIRKANIRSNEAVELYRKAYQKKRSKWRYRKDEESHRIFEDFVTEANQWRADVKAGIRTETAFVDWLKSL